MSDRKFKNVREQIAYLATEPDARTNDIAVTMDKMLTTINHAGSLAAQGASQELIRQTLADWSLCKHVWTNGFVEDGPYWCSKCGEPLEPIVENTG